MPLLQNPEWSQWGDGEFDYQSECHCSKTSTCNRPWPSGLITSQNATAPKQLWEQCREALRLITSQNATAPKLCGGHSRAGRCLITSQNATAPKQGGARPSTAGGLITSQNATAPKLNP